MRNKRKAKQCEFLLIGGFSLGQAGYVEPTITFARGNGYGEDHVRVVERFPIGTKYQPVLDRAKELAKEMNVTLGREFTPDEWLGPEWPEPELHPKPEQSTK